MGFVGVSTGGSSIRTVFPHWADALGLPTRTLVGHDVPLDASPSSYRELVAAIADDPQHWGALVTTHKMAVHAAAADLFDELDDLATTFGEISCIAKREDRLLGSAKDPVTARLALEEFLPADHFGTSGAEALVLGSGGAGTALSQQLGVRADRPTMITCTALTAAELDHAREVHQRSGMASDLVRYVVTAGPDDTDALMARLPAGSLVVNATGMGKDRPGSPLGPDVALPRRRSRLGVQLPRPAGLLAPGAGPARRAGAAGPRRLALLRPRLDAGGGRGVRRADAARHRRRARRDRRPEPLSSDVCCRGQFPTRRSARAAWKAAAR